MATKLKDGVFIGDAEASQDIDFLVSNKIQYVINCAAASVPCSWERLGVRYLTFYWKGSSDCDLSEANVDRMLEFIDNALNSAESVLIHSIDGCSRACAVTAIYFMYKYIWGIDKTMLFIRHQRPDMMPQPAVARQLDNVNQRLLYKYRSNETLVKRISTISWEPLPLEEQQVGGDDEQLLINTFLNSQSAQEAMMQMAKFQAGMGYNRRQRPSSAGRSNRRRKRRLSWIDEKRGKQKAMVPKSPYSGRVTAERPPGTSYSDIQPGVNWVDTLKMSSNSSSIGGNTMSRYNKDNKNRSGNDKSSRHVADENNNNYDNIPLKSILKTSRFNKNKQRNNNSNTTSTTTNEGKTRSSNSISITRKQRTSDRSETKVNVNSNNTNENVEAINNNKNSNVDSSMNNNESKYSEKQSITSKKKNNDEEDMMVHAKWRNDSSELTMTQSTSSNNNASSVKKSNRDLQQQQQQEKEDANTRRLNKLLQSGLGGNNNSIEIESSVESIKQIDAITHHMQQQQQKRRQQQQQQQQQGGVNSGSGSISSLSIYTDDDSSEEDSNLLSGLRRIGAQSTNIRSKQRSHDRRRVGGGNNRGSSRSSNNNMIRNNNNSRSNKGSSLRSSKHRVSTIDRSRQRVRRVDREQQRQSDDLHMYERRSTGRSGTPSRRSRTNNDGRRRRPPSPGLKRNSKNKSNGGYGYASEQRRSTPQRKSRSSMQRPGSAPIRKRNSRHHDEYGSRSRGGGYGVDYGSVNYSRSSLTSLKPKRAGTPNVGKRNQRRQQRRREQVDANSNMNLSSSLTSLTLSNMAKDRQVFNGLSNSSSGTVGAIRALRRRPSSAGRAERTDALRYVGNKPIWR